MSIPDVFLISPKVLSDDRGYFYETFRQDLLEKHIGHEISFVQSNESKSSRGVLRGLHYQLPPYAQAKLVRVIQGRVLDVAVDMRKGSESFGQYVSAELTGDNKHQLFIPRGFAHGFVVLSDSAIFSYKVDNYYMAKYDRGVAFNDADIGIDWKLPLEELRLSDKDKSQPLLSDIETLL